MCRRGDIYLADCGHGDDGSSLQRGMRPVLVVSNDKDRLIKLWGHVTDQRLMARVTAALQIQIGASANAEEV